MSAELRALVKVIHAIGPGPSFATHEFEVRKHDGAGICLVVGAPAEGKPTRILLPDSLTDQQTHAATEEIRRIVHQGGCSPADFFRRVAVAAGMRFDSDADQFTMVIR